MVYGFVRGLNTYGGMQAGEENKTGAKKEELPDDHIWSLLGALFPRCVRIPPGVVVTPARGLIQRALNPSKIDNYIYCVPDDSGREKKPSGYVQKSPRDTSDIHGRQRWWCMGACTRGAPGEERGKVEESSDQ